MEAMPGSIEAQSGRAATLCRVFPTAAGDALRIADGAPLHLGNARDAEVLVFDLPGEYSDTYWRRHAQ